MNILITGCAGFIGYSLSLKLLKSNKKINIIGFDNLNKFYSVKLKNKRLSILKKYKNFKFLKIDLTNKKKLIHLFKSNKINIIYHFAAQAGVRYVSTHPHKFISSNILGFHNLLDVSKNYKISKFFYASSSSVYGDLNKFPVNEKSNLNPKNIYGLSKKLNEEYIGINSNKKTKYIGLRFFTVYGEWGRPDMLILKFLDYAKKNKTFLLNNSGNHWRDFTYIDDVTSIMIKLMSKKFKKNNIYNVCSNRPIFIKELVSYLIKKTGFNKIKNVEVNKFEVYKTHGKNLKIIKKSKFIKYSNFYSSVDKTIRWFKKYNNLI
tara:strand:+ start:244 stop:1200 length:957 start_codon:yes stop_codon:yes gene_type:complete